MDREEFQDQKGTKGIQVRHLKMDPHLESPESQDNQDPEGLKENQEFQVVTVYLELQESLESQVFQGPQVARATQGLKVVMVAVHVALQLN